MRLLITGSRTWTDTERLNRVLDATAEGLAHHMKEAYIRDGLTLVSGHARGVDRMAEAWYSDRFPLEEPELWHADWKKLGKKAGMLRNHMMVESKPDLCVAFIMPCEIEGCERKPSPHGTHGATDCANFATASGVVTRCYYGGAL